MKTKFIKLLQQPIILFLVFVIITGTTVVVGDIFDRIQIKKNPAITFGHPGDTISNPSSGVLVYPGTMKVGSIIVDTNEIAGHNWVVSPNFTFNKYRKTSPTIKMVLDSLGTDSASIYVYDGLYSDLIIAKDHVSLIGVNPSRVLLQRADTMVVMCANIHDFTMTGFTINCSYTAGNSKVIGLYNCYLDSLSVPKIKFSDLTIAFSAHIGVGAPLSVVYSDSASFVIDDCYLNAAGCAGTANYVIYLKNHSNPSIRNSYLKTDNAVTNYGIYCADNTCLPSISRNRCYTYMAFLYGTSNFYYSYQNISNVPDSFATNYINGTNGNVVNKNFYLK